MLEIKHSKTLLYKSKNISFMPVYKKVLFFLDIDECEGNENACNKNENCENVEGKYECFCKEGYVRSGSDCRPGRFLCSYTAVYNTYNTIQYNTIQYNTIQYNTIQYNTIQYNTVQYSTVQYSTIQ